MLVEAEGIIREHSARWNFTSRERDQAWHLVVEAGKLASTKGSQDQNK